MAISSQKFIGEWWFFETPLFILVGFSSATGTAIFTFVI
jgi:hypothetical protein